MGQAAAELNKSEALLFGKPLPALLRFAVPIVLGNVFQQLYNIVDAIVVGRFLGDLPLSGISIASPVMDILYALIIGGTIGVGVLTGQLCGARDWERLRLAHATALLGGSAITVLLSVLGLVFGRRILLAQGNSAEACAQAMLYLTVILIGLICCYLYHYYASLLRAYGDSRTPFIVLLVSSALHALLDVLLIGVLQMGIRGVAYSTVFCQLLSGVWLIRFTHRNIPQLSLGRGELQLDARSGKMLLGFAWAAALQQAVVCIGRLLVQGTLTGLGEQVVTGYNMGMRTEQFLFCFSQGIAAAMVVCLSQNLGRGDQARVQQFYYVSLRVELVMAMLLGTVCFLFPRQIIGIFSDNAAVIAAGAKYTGTMAFFYLFSFFGEVIQSFFRGLGRLRLTMIASLLQVVVRVVLSYLLVPVLGITGICVSVVTGWALLVLIEGAYSLKKAKELTLNSGKEAMTVG